MIHRQAPIHHDTDPGGLQATGHVVVPNALLHPDQVGPHREQSLEQGRNMLRAPKNVDDIDRTVRGGSGMEIRIDWLSEGDASSRMYRDDAVAGALEVCRNTVTWPFRFWTQTDDCNRSGTPNQLGHSRSVRHPYSLISALAEPDVEERGDGGAARTQHRAHRASPAASNQSSPVQSA